MDFILFMFFYLRGVIKFRSKQFETALALFHKALSFKKEKGNKLIFQYVGQIYLIRRDFTEAYKYLSYSYDIYTRNGWVVSNDEERKLVENTLDGLKHISEQHSLTIDNFNSDQNITIKN